jgi:DNA-binding NarL/FixJ family response regulator
MKNIPASVGMLSHSVLHCRSRRKRHLAWEEADSQSNGLYGHYLREIAQRFPTLTLMELKTCALIKGLKGSWEISDILGVSEHTIENHRVNIRRKIGLQEGVSLATTLLIL